MIGGYVYKRPDADLDSRLRCLLSESCATVDLGHHGYLFCDDPFRDDSASLLVSGELTALSQDLLVGAGPDGEYREFDLQTYFASRFLGDEAAAFDAVEGDYRMAVFRSRGDQTTLFLVSHRSGSGRIYYHMLEHGVVFSSDLRFLLRIIKCEVSRLGIYSILKYGAIPEPLTVCSNISAVPPAHYLELDLNRGKHRHIPYFKLRFECEGADGRGGAESEYLPPVKATLQRSSRYLQQYQPAILLSGGIDSSLYGCYLSEAASRPLHGLYCQFGEDDPELGFARQIAERIGSELHVARMRSPDALRVLDDVTRLTDHPFSDFSSLPITFLLQHARERLGEGAVIVECNGGDDCFGFPDLESERKFALKHAVPGAVKRAIRTAFRRSGYWKWESREGLLARVCAMADIHERSALDYFFVLTPVGYLGLDAAREWDDALWRLLDQGFSQGGEDYDKLGYHARTTIRQLLQVNSRRWAAKALSVGESLGLRLIYPYIWRDVLMVQGRVPWEAKVKNGIVKWPLKRLLEEQMPESFIYRGKSGFVPPFGRWLTEERFNRRAREILLDRNAVVAQVVPQSVIETLLSDALQGRRLRHSILNFLWGALFSEMWIQEHACG